MNPEQKENNDADSIYTSTSHCIEQICHYIAKEKKYEEWKAIDCLRTLIGNYIILFAIFRMWKLTLTYYCIIKQTYMNADIRLTTQWYYCYMPKYDISTTLTSFGGCNISRDIYAIPILRSQWWTKIACFVVRFSSCWCELRIWISWYQDEGYVDCHCTTGWSLCETAGQRV